MEKDEIILAQNLALLKASVLFECENFKREKEDKFKSRAELQKAMRNHLNRRFKEDVESVWALQADSWGLK